ncbi:GIY-YIG nuclease family protein [Kordia sp.]|uniref:GIY-YIG nuclease family protein n=1 Tax=Kordia sp. TaxID=1965332 RepID=UPI003B59AE66
MKNPCIYILSNKNNTVLYIGVTSNLTKRIYQHKSKKHKGFTTKYNCNKLVYFEEFQSMNEAIFREKQLKKGNRKRKEELIYKENPEWKDLAEGWLFYFD